VIYKNYIIICDRKPIPDRDFDFSFEHIDYDGPEDHRCGHASSYENAVKQIDEIEEELDNIE